MLKKKKIMLKGKKNYTVTQNRRLNPSVSFIKEGEIKLNADRDKHRWWDKL